MWNRFTESLGDIVAPEEHETKQACSRDAAPSSHSSKGSVPSATVVKEEDEQEQYISDLERALLQQKKQNDALEAKIRELESDRLKEQVKKKAQHGNINEKLHASSQDPIALESESVDAESTRLMQALQQSHAKIDTLVTQCQAQEKEIKLLRKQVKDLEASNETLHKSEREMRCRAAEYEQGYMDSLVEIEKIKTRNDEEKASLMATHDEEASSTDCQRLHDLEAQLLTSEADKVIAQQDAERLQRDLKTLEGVLYQFQVDTKAQKEYTAAVEAELEQVRKEFQTHISTCGEHDDTIDLKRVVDELAIKTRECEHLREAVESTAIQYNADGEVLDKRIAAELVVTYIASEKKSDVLQLMARILGFTDEQKRRAGIGYFVEGNGGGGLFSSIVGLLAPGEEGVTPIDPSMIEGKHFADIWSEFLLKEAAREK